MKISFQYGAHALRKEVVESDLCPMLDDIVTLDDMVPRKVAAVRWFVDRGEMRGPYLTLEET